jgi:TP53 regulating kinase-like protein
MASRSTSGTSFHPLDSWECISQGAEARLWLIPDYLEGKSCIAKERFSKKYRHPTLDARLIKQRCKAEAKCIVRCRRAGIPCPAIWGVHPPVLYLECVSGTTMRAHLEHQAAPDNTDNDKECTDYQALATKMGSILAKLHNNGVVHGDLTTSNMMLNENSDIVMIDFGLSRVSSNPEEFAVDLYVLERALLSTHPELEEKKFLDQVLETYKSECRKSDSNLQKLSVVRMRGRKRECFG